MDTTQVVQTGVSAGLITGIVVFLAVYVLSVIAQWKIFTKAGEAGWKSIIPIYNLYIYCKIVDGKGIKFLLYCIPVVNIIYGIMLTVRLGKAFGQETGFIIGLIFLPNIFWLILGFGSAQYIGPQGPKAKEEAVAAAPEAPQATEDAPVEE